MRGKKERDSLCTRVIMANFITVNNSEDENESNNNDDNRAYNENNDEHDYNDTNKVFSLQCISLYWDKT